MPSLVVLVLYDLSHFEDVLAAWHDAGAAEVTIMDGLGTRSPSEQARRDDLPLLPTVRDLLQSDDAPRRIIFAAAGDDTVAALTEASERVLGDLRQHRNGILAVVPLSQVLGLRPAG